MDEEAGARCGRPGTGALDHYRHAQAIDHVASFYPPMKVYLI